MTTATYHPAQTMAASLRRGPQCKRCASTLLMRDEYGAIECMACGHEVQPAPRPIVKLAPDNNPGVLASERFVWAELRENGQKSPEELRAAIGLRSRVTVQTALNALLRIGAVRCVQSRKSGPGGHMAVWEAIECPIS